MSWRSIRLRLAAAGIATIVFALSLAALGLTALFERHMERWAADEMLAHLDQLAAGLDRGPVGEIEVVHPPRDQRYNQPLSGRYWQITVGDRVLTSRSLWDNFIGRDGEADAAAGEAIGPGGAALYAIERRLILPPRLDNQTVRIVVAMNRSELREAAARFIGDLWPYILLLGAALIAGGLAQVTLGLRPLARLGARVAAVRSGAAGRMGSDYPTEVTPLTEEIDALLSAREEELSRARTRASDLAHALKTPLQALAGEADRLAAGGQTDVSDGLRIVGAAMRRHVERELSRARIAAGATAARCAPAEVVGKLLSVIRRTPEGALRTWSVDATPDLRARIDKDDLTEALGALLENAARHAREKVEIEIGVAADNVFVEIRDDGEGIDEARLAEMTVRGVRFDTKAAGSGLGLAIAAEVCDAAEGRLSLRNLRPGFTARMEMPQAPAPAAPA